MLNYQRLPIWSRWNIHKNLGHTQDESPVGFQDLEAVWHEDLKARRPEKSWRSQPGNSWGFLGKSWGGWDLVHARLIRFQVLDGLYSLYQLFLPEKWGWLVLALTTLAHWGPNVIWFWDLDGKQLPILVLNHHQGKWANHGCTILHEKHRGVWVFEPPQKPRQY